MEQANTSYFKAILIVLLLALISFCFNAVFINPFEKLPYFFLILIAFAGAASCLALFKARKFLAVSGGVVILKTLVCLVLAVVFFSSLMSIFTPQIKNLLVEKKYDDYYVRIAEQDRYQTAYYYFAVARKKNNEKFLVNFEKNNMMRNFTYLTGDELDKFTNFIKTSRDKNLIKLYDELNKDGRINLNEMLQLQEFIIKYGVHNDKPPF